MARKPYRPAVHVLARNVRAAYDAATDDDLARGRSWYADAYAACVAMDAANPSRAAGVIAALSPQKGWRDNVDAARAFYNGQPVPAATRANVAKAQAIADGAAPLDVLGGHKVRAFYRNIVGDADAVTIDRHAVDAARARRGAYATHDTKSAYVNHAFCEAYRRVAADVGETPAAVQAIVWCAWRRMHDTHTHRQDVAA